MKMKEVFDCCVRDDGTKDCMLYKLHRLEELIVWGRLIGNSLTLNLLSLCHCKFWLTLHCTHFNNNNGKSTYISFNFNTSQQLTNS